MELHDSAQAEAQRRAAQHCHSALILPAHVLHILTQGNVTDKLVERSQALDSSLSALL